MPSVTGRCAMGAPEHPRLRALGVLGALAFAAAGCTTDGAPPGMAATAVAARGSTIAFESIDGPPIGVFQKLVVDLSEEAQSRQIMVVSRENAAAYRIRGFLAVRVMSGRPQVAWVWDVYDAEKRRALRISGEESGTQRGSDAWAAVDDQILRRIARLSVDRLVTFLASPGSAPPLEPAPAPGEPAVAAAEAVRQGAADVPPDAIGFAAAPP